MCARTCVGPASVGLRLPWRACPVTADGVSVQTARSWRALRSAWRSRACRGGCLCVCRPLSAPTNQLHALGQAAFPPSTSGSSSINWGPNRFLLQLLWGSVRQPDGVWCMERLTQNSRALVVIVPSSLSSFPSLVLWKWGVGRPDPTLLTHSQNWGTRSPVPPALSCRSCWHRPSRRCLGLEYLPLQGPLVPQRHPQSPPPHPLLPSLICHTCHLHSCLVWHLTFLQVPL